MASPVHISSPLSQVAIALLSRPVEAFTLHVNCTTLSKGELITGIGASLRLNGHSVELFPLEQSVVLYDLLTEINGQQFYVLAVPGSLVQNIAQYRFEKSLQRSKAKYITVKSIDEFKMVYDCIMKREKPNPVL